MTRLRPAVTPMDLTDDAFLGGALQYAATEAQLPCRPRRRPAGCGLPGASRGACGRCGSRRGHGRALRRTARRRGTDNAGGDGAGPRRSGAQRMWRATTLVNVSRSCEADVAKGGRPFQAASESTLKPGAFVHAVANPPYLSTGGGTEPPDRLKAAAHQMPEHDLDQWVRFLATALTGDGTATMIHRADALQAVLSAFASRFGAVRVFPIFPREGTRRQPGHRARREGQPGAAADPAGPRAA